MAFWRNTRFDAVPLNRSSRIMNRRDENGEKALCFKCLAENESFVSHCRKCGSPINASDVLGPFSDLSMGKGGHYKMDFRPHNPFILLGVWFLFGMPILIIPFIIYSMIKEHSPEWQFLFMGAAWIFCSFIVIRYTLRYFQIRKTHYNSEDPPADDEPFRKC